MVIDLKKKKACPGCKGNLNGVLSFVKFTGKDKPGDSTKGRGIILSACNKCGYCSGSKGN